MNFLKKIASLFRKIALFFRKPKVKDPEVKDPEVKEPENKKSKTKKPKNDDLVNSFNTILSEYLDRAKELIEFNSTLFKNYLSDVNSEKPLNMLNIMLSGGDIFGTKDPKILSDLRHNRCSAVWVKESFMSFEKLLQLYNDIAYVLYEAMNIFKNECVSIAAACSREQELNDKIMLQNGTINEFRQRCDNMKIKCKNLNKKCDDLNREYSDLFNKYSELENDYAKLFLPISNCQNDEKKQQLLRDEISRYMLAINELRVVENVYHAMEECINYDQLKQQVFNLKTVLQEFNERVKV